MGIGQTHDSHASALRLLWADLRLESSVAIGENRRPSVEAAALETKIMRLLLAFLLLALPCLTQPLRPEVVPVGEDRELRGVWVASVNNMHFPSRAGLSPEQAKAELEALVARVAECRLNAIFFQVRPEGDALYASELEPWSRFLSGRQGQDPGYDPLATLIPLAQARGIEVHAWLNPYRASASPPEQTSLVAPHIGAVHPEAVTGYGSFVWMQPGLPEVQDRLVEVCEDLARRYDIDGLHFDDYFYPYPEGGRDFPDDATWEAYRGSLSRADWRRDSVNRAIAEVARTLHRTKPYLRFGISPFGLPAPRRPEGIMGFDQYEKLYADPQLWSDRAYVDYLAPQLYWPTTRKEQALQPLLEWWTSHARGGRYTFPGLNLNGLGAKPEWTIDEYRTELSLVRANLTRGSRGAIWWSVQPLLEDRQGKTVALFQELYPGPALTPPLARARDEKVAPPRCRLEQGRVIAQARGKTPISRWAVYQRHQQRWRLRSVHPAGEAISLPAGDYAISALTREGAQSLGQLVTLR